MRRVGLPVAVLALVCTLTACAASEPTAEETTTSPDATVQSEAGQSETVQGEPGAPTVLDFGVEQTVAWAPSVAVSGDVSITVERVRAGDFADFAGLEGSGITKDNQPYYVDATIGNNSQADFGGLDVPLYLQDSAGTLSPPWGFAEPFKPCGSRPLPADFGPGETVSDCLVFFASPGATFESITFQPSAASPAVNWTGDVTVHAKRQQPRRRR